MLWDEVLGDEVLGELPNDELFHFLFKSSLSNFSISSFSDELQVFVLVLLLDILVVLLSSFT
jgi:hypothetical protein